MGTRRDHRRLRAADPHDSAGCHRHAAADRKCGRPAPHGVRGDYARRLQAGRRSGEVPGADQGRAPSVAAKEAVSPRRVRLPRRAAAGRQGHSRQRGRLRFAARQDLQRDRHRSAQHAQMPGHGAAALAAGARLGRVGVLPARRNHADGTDAERRDVAVRRRRQHDSRPCTIRRRAPAEGSQRGAERHRDRDAGGAEIVRHGERRSHVEVPAGRALRAPRASPLAPLDADRRGRQVRDRLPPASEGRRVPAGHRAGSRRED